MATPENLDLISVDVPEEALEVFESALSSVCRAVGFFLDEARGIWRIEGVKERGAHEAELEAALALAGLVSGYSPLPERTQVAAGGWLARTRDAFPEQFIGTRFAIRGTHVTTAPAFSRITITLDAGLAFGTGEHNSTRLCLLALERIARGGRPARILDLGTGSGILGLAAAKLFGRDVLATDIDARAVRVANANAVLNRAQDRFRAIVSDGWAAPALMRAAPYDLVFANILARPLAAMAKDLAAHLAPGGTAVLAGLLATQARWVLGAHRRHGLVLDRKLDDGAWSALILRKPEKS